MRQQIGRHTTNHRVAKAYKILNEKKKYKHYSLYVYESKGKRSVKGLQLA